MSSYLRGVRTTASKCGKIWERPFLATVGCRNHSFALNFQSEKSRAKVFEPHKISNRFIHISGTRFEVVTVKCPPFAESISEGDVRWEKEVGDQVEIDDTVAEVETDKTGIPIPSPVAGVIESLLVEDGATVQPGVELFKVNTSGSGAAPTEAPSKPAAEAPASAPPAAETPAPAAAAPTPVPTEMPPVPAAPTQPVATQATPAPSAIKQPPAAPTPAPAPATSSRSENRVKMNRMRQRISQRLKDAQNTAAMLTTFNEIDMTNIIAFRKRHKDAFQKKHGLKLSFMSAFIKASTYALKDQPTVNAVIDDNTNEIVYRDYIDISVAVATPKGLVVPVLRDCNNLNYLEIDRELDALAQKARSNNLTVEDMDGGTFTISNGGVFGSMFGTPIINLPQSSILGMHATIERPVAINGKIEIRPMMYVALTYDHRLIDGREAVTFLKKIKQGVEDPLTLEIQL